MNTGLLFTIPAGSKRCAPAMHILKTFFQHFYNLSLSNILDSLEFEIFSYTSLRVFVYQHFLLNLFS